jgi:threonine dehydrogenase-like Zn-dependent dehydrogenase
MEIMKSGKWDIEQIITDEFAWENLPQAIERASDTEHALNVIIHF